MSGHPEDALPLAGRVLSAGPDAEFVVAEWSDDGRHPGMPIAPIHMHLDEDEAWYVLEGTLDVLLGGRRVHAAAGTAVVAPKGTPHTYANPGPGPVRYLLVMQPRTWALIQALHGADRSATDLDGLFRTHGSVLLPDVRPGGTVP
jgi:mannose-6-phosphate isomerase-like protein (cupin superfamily)